MLKLLLLFTEANKPVSWVAILFFVCRIRSTSGTLISQHFLGQNWQCSQQHVRFPKPEKRSLEVSMYLFSCSPYCQCTFCWRIFLVDKPKESVFPYSSYLGCLQRNPSLCGCLIYIQGVWCVWYVGSKPQDSAFTVKRACRMRANGEVKAVVSRYGIFQNNCIITAIFR